MNRQQYRVFIILLSMLTLFALNSVPIYGQNGGDSPNIIFPANALHSQHFLSQLAGYPTVVNPSLVTTDSSGNIYESDINLNVVKEFNPAGTVIKTFGTGGGTGNGQFNFPSGVTIAGTYVIVGDSNNNRVQLFDKSSGNYLSQFSVPGGKPGQIAYDPANGLIYVVEVNNNRVNRFNGAGVSQGTFGILGSGAGQFNKPLGIAIDPLGYIYVSDVNNNRVEKFSSTGTYIRTIGSAGSGDGQFSSPGGLSVDRAGFLYVADTFNGRIQKFDWKGNFAGKYGLPGSFSCGGTSGYTCHGLFSLPTGVAVSNVLSTQPIVYVADTGNSTLQSFEASLQPVSHSFQAGWGATGSGAGQFSGPYGTAVDSASNVYVTDYTNNRVQKFDQFGNFIKQWGTVGTGNGQFSHPTGIAINSANNVYVVDSGNNRIQQFDTNGGFVRTWGQPGNGGAQFAAPTFIAVDNTYIYVSDSGNNRIQKFDFSGGFITQWAGSGLGQLNGPQGIAVDINRQFVYVSELNTNRLQIFTVFGDPVLIVADSKTGPGQLNVPEGVSTDQRGNVYVVDTGNSRVVQFNDNGQYVGTFGTAGSSTGQFISPYGVTVDRTSGQIFVAENFNNNVQRYGSFNPKTDTVGVWRPSTRSFYMRNSNTTGIADISVDTSAFTQTTDQPIVGDWNGDGVSTVGIYRNGLFLLRDSNIPGSADYSFALGISGDVPIVGDWNADGKDGVGVFRPSNGLIYLKNDLTTGFADYQMVLGTPGDIGLGGDWNGDGQDSAGVRRPSTIYFYLADKVINGSVFAEHGLQLGVSTDSPFTGDWVHQGTSGVGVFRPSNGLIYLKNNLNPGFADTQITLGIANDAPVGGYWGPIPAESIPSVPSMATEPTLKLAPTFVP